MIQFITFLKNLKEEDNPTVAATAPLGVAVVARRLCTSKHLDHTYYRPVYGDRECNYAEVVLPLVDLFKTKANDETKKDWVRILNIIAQGELGAREGLSHLQEIAKKREHKNKLFFRLAALNAMSYSKFTDMESQDKIFTTVLPIAESPLEDYRVREMAYSTLLTWPVNSTFVHRLSRMSLQEKSVNMQDFIRSTIDSFTAFTNPHARLRTIATAEQDVSALTRWVSATVDTPKRNDYDLFVANNRIGSRDILAWLTQFEKTVPVGLAKLLTGKAGDIRMPIYEGVAFLNDVTDEGTVIYVGVIDFLKFFLKK